MYTYFYIAIFFISVLVLVIFVLQPKLISVSCQSYITNFHWIYLIVLVSANNNSPCSFHTISSHFIIFVLFNVCSVSYFLFIYFSVFYSLLTYRMLSQLNESSTAFDEFWIQHQNKLDLCLKLCQFEHNFQQVLHF